MKEINALLLSQETDSNWRAVLSIRMDLLALMISREAENYVKGTVLKNARPLVKDFWTLINKHFISQKTVSWYADQLQVSITYLNLLCRKYLNVTAKQLIEQRVLLEAKQRLRFSGMSVKEIAYDLGFSDMPSFSNHFKKKSGFSPKEYQQ
jgi:AraC-like DNA-binding protein